MLATQLHRKRETRRGWSGEVSFSSRPNRNRLVPMSRQPRFTKLLEAMEASKALFERGTNIIILRSFAALVFVHFM
jgi:hypothetical protein